MVGYVNISVYKLWQYQFKHCLSTQEKAFKFARDKAGQITKLRRFSIFKLAFQVFIKLKKYFSSLNFYIFTFAYCNSSKIVIKLHIIQYIKNWCWKPRQDSKSWDLAICSYFFKYVKPISFQYLLYPRVFQFRNVCFYFITVKENWLF